MCDCVNEKFGFSCVCEFVKKHPGDREFGCGFHGLYNASKPVCNKCQETTDSKETHNLSSQITTEPRNNYV